MATWVEIGDTPRDAPRVEAFTTVGILNDVP